jgi:RNA polymerase sigma factor (sigma-70 family)
VCRRALTEISDAEDAFQATFLVLVRRARGLIKATTIGPWLYKVASWTAANVRRKNARLPGRFQELTDAVADPRPLPEPAIDVDVVLLGLPERYRNAVVLCCLAGMTHREAAEQLGCAEGTVSSLLSRGLARLRAGLAGRDPAAVLAVVASAIPIGIAEAAARSAVALRLASLSTTASPAVAALAKGVLRMFWIKKATTIGLATAALAAVGVCVGVSLQAGSVANGREQPEPGKSDSPERPPVARAVHAPTVDPEKKPPADPPEKGAKVWPQFAKAVGEDKAARQLFDRIVANAASLEVLEKATSGDPNLLKTYLAKRDELNVASRKANQPPVDEIAAWLLLGTYSGTTGGDEKPLRFLNISFNTTRNLFEGSEADAMGAKSPIGGPLRKLIAAWLANHANEEPAVFVGLMLSMEYGIPESLPTARQILKPAVGLGLQEEWQMHRSMAMLVVGKYGTKDDIALIRPHFSDRGVINITVIDGRQVPKQGGEVKARDGKDVTTQVGDVALTAAIGLRGGSPQDFGFIWPTKLYRTKVTDPCQLKVIGFVSAADREAGHKTAKEWLDKQSK